ncbi:hypothetical protein N9Q58_01025 [Polaribacter sp.]|nr:hypothetical protein [Polaribacter sp.]
MNIILEVLFTLVLVILCFQDFKERKVSLSLLVLAILLGGSIHFQQQNRAVFLVAIAINVLIVFILFLIIGVYAKIKMKQPVFNVIGLGDLFFFMVLAVSFPTLSFLVLFVFSLIFSWSIFMLIKQHLKEETVPLAGLQSLFLMLVLMTNWITNSFDLFAM